MEVSKVNYERGSAGAPQWSFAEDHCSAFIQKKSPQKCLTFWGHSGVTPVI